MGDVTWKNVKGKFGYWRLPGQAPQSFFRCIFAGACLGAPNVKLKGQFHMNGTDLAVADTEETCNTEWGHSNTCNGERCRLCNSCIPNFKPGAKRGRCDKCPAEQGENVLLLILGVAVVIALACGIIAMTIVAGGGAIEVSEATKKILINYLQVVSLAAVFPVRWPSEIESFFAFQSAISSVSQTLLSPDCELSHLAPADAFYQKQVGFAFLPVVIVLVCTGVWHLARIIQSCREGSEGSAEGSEGSTKTKRAYYNDRAIISWVTLLYLAYPTSVTQGLSMMGCENIGGKLWLAADLQEACYVGRHMTNWWLLALPQIILFVLGLPLMASLVLWKNRHTLHSHDTQFRWGILYAGYRDQLYWWEITIVIRKLVMVLVGGVFASRLGPDMQIYLSLALVVVFVVGHLVAQPFNELTIHHKMLHWLELGALLACFATLYSGMLFYLGHETGRIPEWSLNLASFVIIFGNTSFMLYSVVVFVLAMRREAKEARGMTSAERRLHLRKLSKNRQRSQHNATPPQTLSVVRSRVVLPRRTSHALEQLHSIARSAVVHNKGLVNFTNHGVTKSVLQKKVQQKQLNSRARLNGRLKKRHTKALSVEGGSSKKVAIKEARKKVVDSQQGVVQLNVAPQQQQQQAVARQVVVAEEKKETLLPPPPPPPPRRVS